MIDEIQNRTRPMNDCLCVRVDGGEAKPAMDTTLQFVGGNFQLCSETISVFCHASEVYFSSTPPPLSHLKKPSFFVASVFYTLPSNWCLINLWQTEVGPGASAPLLTKSLNPFKFEGKPRTVTQRNKN